MFQLTKKVLVDENLDNIVREDNQSEQGPFIPILNDGAQREETGLGQEPDVQHIQNITLDYQALEFSSNNIPYHWTLV